VAILITIDVEDYFQVENLRPFFPHSTWEKCDLRVESSTHRLLDLFDRHSVKATFFFLGWIAERCPGLVREVRNRGHEIASHGYHHQVTFELSKEELRDDLYRSKCLLEDLTGERVLGYRAPKFSLSRNVLDSLAELGYQYDSSYNAISGFFSNNGSTGGPEPSPLMHSLTDSPGTPSFPVTIQEIPISSLRIGGMSIPLGGGGYFRLWPTSWFERGAAHILRSEGRYVFYLHPWELDHDQPRVKEAGGLRRFKHYLNLDRTLDRFDHFLTRFESSSFRTCTEYLETSKSKMNSPPTCPAESRTH